VISIMKLAQITLALFFIALMCIIVAALPDLGYLTEDDCRECHGDSSNSGKVTAFHHFLIKTEEYKCMDCHTLPFKEGWRSCDNCHMDFDHHEDAQGRCADCHDEKQKKKQSKKGRKH